MTASSSSAIAASFLSSQSFGSRSLSSFFHHFTSIRSYSSVTFSSSRSIGSIFTRNSCNLDIATRTITRRNHRLFVASSNDNVSLSSKRGRDAPTYLPSYLRDARNVEIYHPTLRPNGALQLSVAENYMMEDLLVPAFSSAHQTSSFSSDLIYYQPTQGREDLRRVLCDSYLPFLLHLEGNGSTSSLNPNNLVVGAGCNAVLENICLCLAEFGEGIMIPTPYYAAFEFDLTCRIGLKIIPVHPYPSLKGSPTRTTPSLDDYYPTFASLENAYALAKDSGIVPRILLLSHPNNPLGIIYPKSVLQEILAWCQSRDMHVISDEIYAGSVFPPTAAAKSSSYEGTEFTSMLHLVTPAMKDQVHWIYALSKDFCLSGLRVGLCYTQNEEILYPLQKLNDLCQVSSITQSILVKLLNTSSTSFPVKFHSFFCFAQRDLPNYKPHSIY